MEAFKSVSGLKLNNKKTTVLRIGSSRNTAVEYLKHLNFLWSSESAKTLGIIFFAETKKMQEQNLYPKLNDFTNCLKRWQHRKLTLMGKITVIKTFALPKLIYPFTVLLDPPKEVIQKLNSEIFSFIWDSKPDKIKRSTLYRDHKNGGLRMINLECFLNSLKASWMKRIFDDESTSTLWKSFYKQKLDSFGNKLVLESNLKENDCTQISKNNKFLKNILSAWCKINYKETPSTCISKQIIWNNSYIKCDNNIIYYKEWHEKGIKYIEHIYDYRSNTFYNFDNLQNLYNLNTTDFLKYHQIINNIIEGWKRLLKRETAMEQGIDRRKTNIDIISMKHNINKTLNSTQLKDTSQEKLKSEVKWTNDFQNYDIVWEVAYQMAHRCTIDMKLRNFQYKYLMRIVPNNKYLFKCKLAPTVLCDFCAMQEETNAHLFWECSYVQEYWSKIQKFLKDNNLEIELTYYRISFGILDKNNIKTSMINFIILIAKYWIFASKYKKQRPSSEGFLKVLHERKETEHYIAQTKDKLEHHNQKWGFLRSFE